MTSGVFVCHSFSKIMVPYHCTYSVTTQLGQKRWKKLYNISKSAKNLQNFDVFTFFLMFFLFFWIFFLLFHNFSDTYWGSVDFALISWKKIDSSMLSFLFCLIYILKLGNYDPRGSRFKNPWIYSNQTLNLACFSYSLPKIVLSMEAHTVYYLIWGKTPSMQLK